MAALLDIDLDFLDIDDDVGDIPSGDEVSNYSGNIVGQDQIYYSEYLPESQQTFGQFRPPEPLNWDQNQYLQQRFWHHRIIMKWFLRNRFF
jgi:hypothetical protein